MLVREQTMIIAAVVGGWDKISTAINQGNAVRRAKLWDDHFVSDPRLVLLVRALEEAGIVNAEEVATSIVKNEFPMAYGYSFGGIRPEYDRTNGVAADYKEMFDTVTSSDERQLPIHREGAYQELAIALATCKKKWPQLQTAVYGLMADMGVATTYEECRMAIRTFTMALAEA
jgi:hypothetical protein